MTQRLRDLHKAIVVKDMIKYKLEHWYNALAKSSFKSFKTLVRPKKTNYDPVSQYGNHRSVVI